jgi:hypothetical protein
MFVVVCLSNRGNETLRSGIFNDKNLPTTFLGLTSRR